MGGWLRSRSRCVFVCNYPGRLPVTLKQAVTEGKKTRPFEYIRVGNGTVYPDGVAIPFEAA